MAERIALSREAVAPYLEHAHAWLRVVMDKSRKNLLEELKDLVAQLEVMSWAQHASADISSTDPDWEVAARLARYGGLTVVSGDVVSFEFDPDHPSTEGPGSVIRIEVAGKEAKMTTNVMGRYLREILGQDEP